MNRIARAQYNLSRDLARVARNIQQHGRAMNIPAEIRADFLRRCAAVAELADDFDATAIGEVTPPVMPFGADEDDDVLEYFDQDESSTVIDSENVRFENTTLDRVASRLASRYSRSGR